MDLSSLRLELAKFLEEKSSMPRNPFSPRVYYFQGGLINCNETVFGTSRQTAARFIRESTSSFLAIYDNDIYLGERVDSTNWKVDYFSRSRRPDAQRSTTLLEDYINLDTAAVSGFKHNLMLNRVCDLSVKIAEWSGDSKSDIEFHYKEPKDLLCILISSFNLEIFLRTHALFIGPFDFYRVVNWIEKVVIEYKSILEKCTEYPIPFLQGISKEFFRGTLFNGKRNMLRYLQFCRVYSDNELLFHQFGCENAYFGVKEYNNWIDTLSLIVKNPYKPIVMKGIVFSASDDWITCKIAGCTEINIVKHQVDELKKYYDGAGYQMLLIRAVCFILFYLKISNQYDSFASRLFRMSLSS